MADALKSGWLQLVDDTSYTASKKKTPKEREEWRVSMTSRIHHDTDAESIKGSEVTEDNGKWRQVDMDLHYDHLRHCFHWQGRLVDLEMDKVYASPETSARGSGYDSCFSDRGEW